MNRKFAKLGLVQLLTIMMLVVAGSAFAAGEALMHNSNNLGTKYGNWGTVGGKYGEFTCTTCHNKTTDNVKRVAGTLTTTLGNWSSIKTSNQVPVVFNNMTAFGTDAAAHTTSTAVCQVCHSKTAVHRYNKPVAQLDSNHKGANQTDCTSCHSHADAFKGKGCTSCHGSYAASTNPITTGKHTAHIANAVYGCVDCHAKSVTDDETLKSAPTAHQNSTLGDYSGARAGGSYAAGNCSNVYCHTDGKGGVPAVAVNWATGPALDCKGCHGGGSSQAGEPRYPNVGAGATDANSHLSLKHVGVSDAASCQNCHGATMSGTALNASGKHTDRVIDVVQGNSKTFTYTAGTKTCSTSSCHSNGFFTAADAQWGATLNCAGCHATTSLTSGSHNKHLNSTIVTSFTCDTCHADTAASNIALKLGTSAHINNQKNVKFSNFSTFANFTNPNCSNLYCHSYGTNTSGPFKVKTAPVWGGAAVNCFSCHGSDKTTGLLNNMSTGRHKKHMVGNYSYSCATCHAATVSFLNNTSITDPSKHVNQQIEVSFSGKALTGGASASYYTPAHAPGGASALATDSCSNIYCHSNGQTVQTGGVAVFRSITGAKRWGQTGTIGCSGCHGYTSSLGQLSGKHQKHAAAPVSFNCNQCHLNGGTNNSSANHVNGLVNYSSQWTGRVTLADGKCNNVYCHSNGKGTFVNMTSANWFSTRTLDCKGCHGGTSSQAGEPFYANGGIDNVLANNHPQHVGTTGADATCQNCHSNTVTGVLLNASTHTVSLAGSNRAIPYHADQSMSDTKAGVYSGNGKTFTYTAASKTCSNISCHNGNGLVAGVADARWGADFTCDNCHGGNSSATNKITTGQHAKHTDQSGVIGVNFGCVACHAQTVTNDTTLAAVNAHMNALANFSGAKAGKNTASCQTAYCHSDGKGGAGTTVSWTTGPAINDCNGCHGGVTSSAGEPVYPTTAPETLRTNSHPKHVGTAGADATCQNCHGTTMNGVALSNSGNHLNGSINVVQGVDVNKTFNYSNDSTKTCSNINCHSGGGMFTAADIKWGAAMPADCTGCHGNEVSTSPQLSGAHNKHTNGINGGTFNCNACHAPTITNADNRTIGTVSNHGNTVVNYSGAKAGRNKTCSTIYCHSNGKGIFTSPVWSAINGDGCNYCHPQTGLSGQYAHTPHLAVTVSCAHCHTPTGSTHINGTVDIEGGGTFRTKLVSFNPGTGTCSAVSCHSPAAAGPYNNSATWGVKANCETCHPKAGLSGAHQVHMGAINLPTVIGYDNMTANRTPAVNDSTRKHGFGCAECHPVTSANHLNGTIDVDLNRVNVAGVGSLRFLNASSASYDMGSTKKCSNIYCHSNASRLDSESNVKANTSLAWTDTYANHPTEDRCAQCHGNQPTTGAHVAHAISNHSNNIYNGKDGKVGFKGTGNSAHGNPNTTTTITCYICHTDTVSDTAHGNDMNDKCRGCHNGTAISKGLVAINNLANHVNGKREIKFAAIKVRSKAQVRPESFKFYSGMWKRSYYKNMTSLAFDEAKVVLDTDTMWHPSTPNESNCSNLACHNGYTAKWNMANWNDPNKCMDCHFKL